MATTFNMRSKRQAITRSRAAALGYTRLQNANAGTLNRRVPGHVLGPPNTNWAELEGGVQRPAWLTPKKPTWVAKGLRYAKYGGLGTLALGSAAQLAYDIYNTPSAQAPKPLKGYLDKIYKKKQFTTTKPETQIMAPIRKTMRKQTRVIKRRFRKRAPRAFRGKRRGRRMRRGKRSPLMRAIRRTSKRIRMGHYTNEKRYLRVCDNLSVADFTVTNCTGTDSDFINGVAQYKDLSFRISSLPNLVARLGSTTDKFDEFKIDKITYKVRVLNARQLAMDPNYKAPDGYGQDVTPIPTKSMLNKHDYVPNTYVFHKRWQNDDRGSEDFTDWKKCRTGMKGSCTFVSLFRQKGKMFNTAITADRGDDIYINNTAILQKKHGAALGWQKNSTDIQDLKIGQGGLIIPGMSKKGWDNTTNNIKPLIRVSVRVCSSLRSNGGGIDIL